MHLKPNTNTWVQVGYEVADPQLVKERGERMRYDYSYILAVRCLLSKSLLKSKAN